MSGSRPFDDFEDSRPDVLKSLRVPPWCPICGLPMKGAKSTSSFYDFGCCRMCHIYFVEHREQRWRDGWRPSEDEVKRMHASIEPSW